MRGCSQGVFPRLEISEGLYVVRSRSGGARLFTGGITACMLGSATVLYFLCA